MFGLGLDEIFLIVIIFLLFVDPKHWNNIAKKAGYLFGKYQSEVNKFKTIINNSSEFDEFKESNNLIDKAYNNSKYPSPKDDFSDYVSTNSDKDAKQKSTSSNKKPSK